MLVLAVLDDKDLAGIVSAYADLANHVVVTEAPSPRTAPLARIAGVAAEVWDGTGVAVETAKDVAEALELATGIAGEGDGIVVAGSLYTVGAARDGPISVPSDKEHNRCHGKCRPAIRMRRSSAAH